MENPDRFNVKPTLGELSTRKPLPPPHDMTTSEKSDLQDQGNASHEVISELCQYTRGQLFKAWLA